jgi:hypothetical protein
MPGHFSAAFSVRVTKDGYVPATKMVACAAGCSTAQSPEAQVVITLQSLAASVDVTGTYTLTLVADTACAAQLPDALRTRTYTAAISPAPVHGFPPGSFAATLSCAVFLPGNNTLIVGVAGSYVTVDNVDEEGLVELVTPATYLSIFFARPLTSVETPGTSTISAPFDGSFRYCVSGATLAPAPSLYSCLTEHPIATAECVSANHRLILARQ